MMRLPFSYLSAYKRELRASLAGPGQPPLPSGHLSEALAWAAGFRTHAALTQAQPRSVSLDPARLWARLEELGHPRPQGRSKLALSTPGHTPGDDFMMLTPMGLGYSPEQAHALAWMARQTTGAVLVTGATCAGKSTTVRSLAFSSISTPPRPRIAQDTKARGMEEMDPAPAISSSFPRDALLAAMRADPQRLVLGEVRSQAAAQALVETVQSGKAVWSTLHADSLSNVFSRLLALGAPLRQLNTPNFLVGLVHQRLMPVLCHRCATPLDLTTVSSLAQGHLSRGIRDTLSLENDLPHLRQRGEGCAQCRHTGYVHRTLVAAVVTAEKDDLSPRQRFAKNGPHLSTHALEKVRAGLLDLRDVHSLVDRLDRTGPPVA